MRTFSINCTRPADQVAYVSGPNVRSTLDIFWSCLSVILICTWSMLHLNVPVQSTPCNKTKRFARTLCRLYWKLIWMIVIIIIPEWAFAKAWTDFRKVSRLEEKFKEWSEKDQVPWTRKHTHLVLMGGFTIQFEYAADRSLPNNISTTQDRISSIYLEDTTATPDSPAEEQTRPSGGTGIYYSWVLDAKDLLEARRVGDIEKLPYLAEDDLDDRDSGDLMAKIVAVGQLFWFVTQLIVRLSRSLPTAQLEVMTLAFAVNAIFTYPLLLDKPRGVQYSIKVTGSKPQPVWLYRDRSSISNFNIPDEPWRLPDDEPSELQNLYRGFGLSTFIFGAVHCIGWGYTFPSPIEKLLWRISSISSAAILPLGYLATLIFVRPLSFRTYILWPGETDLEWFKTNGVLPAITFLSTVTYTAARLFVVVEAIRSLAFLPSEAYASTWAQVLPHIS